MAHTHSWNEGNFVCVFQGVKMESVDVRAVTVEVSISLYLFHFGPFDPQTADHLTF